MIEAIAAPGAPPQGATDTQQSAAGSSGPTSVLQALNDVNRRLERQLLELHQASSADNNLRTIAHALVGAVELNPDVALACIFLNQIGGLYAVRHCIETAVVAVLIARAMHKAEAEVLTIAAASLTMNVGMLKQTENFQGKDCALSHEEKAMVLRHPAESADLLRCAGVSDPDWLDYVLLHHENEDGSGYPEGRSGLAIPQNAKLIGLADRYCAHVSARNYRRSMLPDRALRSLFLDSEAAVDSELAGMFVRVLGTYPPGCLVRMRNGEIGVVAARAASPTVHALLDAQGKPLGAPAVRASVDPGHAIAEALHEDQARVRFSMRQIWGEYASL